MIGVVFKKGHIIPRWCHVKTDDRKAQHCVTFGCDVEVVFDGGVVRIFGTSDGAIIHVRGRKGPSRRMRGGSTKYSRAVCQHVYCDFSRVNDATVVRMQSTNSFVSARMEL